MFKETLFVLNIIVPGLVPNTISSGNLPSPLVLSSPKRLFGQFKDDVDVLVLSLGYIIVSMGIFNNLLAYLIIHQRTFCALLEYERWGKFFPEESRVPPLPPPLLPVKTRLLCPGYFRSLVLMSAG